MPYPTEIRLQFYVYGCSQTRTDTLDGGSVILINCLKRWINNGHRVHLFTSQESYARIQKYGLPGISYTIVPGLRHRRSVYLLYVMRTIKLLLVSRNRNHKNLVIYSVSDFWPDSIPAAFHKFRHRSAKWVAAFYLFAPNPFSTGSPYKGKRFITGLLYYLSQIPIYLLVRKYADMVFVTSEPDRGRFISARLPSDRVVAVRGGVDFELVKAVPNQEKKFDAVYLGRFHPQKGVLELLDIWKYVCQRKHNAMLAMIGTGELEEEVRGRVEKLGLQRNIKLFGFRDGIEKIKILRESKIVVHPATYDSGGMAAAEAMACGLPGVSFDLEALKTYYPKGMLKTPCFNIEEFAGNILRLLDDRNLYAKMGKDALEQAKDWDWKTRSLELLERINALFYGQSPHSSLEVHS